MSADAAAAGILRLVAGPAAFLAVLVLEPFDLPHPALFTLAATVWVALWWILEPVPSAVTSLLPLVLLPAGGVRSAAQLASSYFNDLIALFLGGFILAHAIERCGLHRRFALAVLMRAGTSQRRLCLGFLLVATLISCWISNTATTLLLLPIATAVIGRIRQLSGQEERQCEQSILLALAFGATIGGMGTLIGTPANLLIRNFVEVSFLQWMVAALPLVALLFCVAAALLVHGLSRESSPAAVAALREESLAMPAWTRAERLTAGVFLLTVLLWTTRQPIAIGEVVLFGWTRLLPRPEFVQDGTVAILAGLLLFVLRVKDSPSQKSRPLISWREAERSLPWGILLLFGGGIAVGDAFESSGLSKELGQALSRHLTEMSPLLILFVTILFVTAMSEVASNTATASILLPIFAALAPGMGVEKLALLMPVVLAASLGFMLPVATGPNAVVYATSRVPLRVLLRKGMLLDVAGVVVIALYMRVVGFRLLGVRWEASD